MSIVSGLILAGSTFLFIRGFIYYQREKLFRSLFEDLEKGEDFDFDYIQNLTDLPLGKLIALCAQTDNDDDSKKTAKFKQNTVLFSSIVEDKENQQDKIWKINEGVLNFRVRNMLGQTIEINNKKNEVFLFNLKKIETVDQFDKKAMIIQLNPVQRLKSLMGQKILFTEYGIEPESHTVFMGKLNKDLKGNLSFEPKVISGENRSLFLKYLDEHIVSINTKGKKTFYLFFGLLAIETSRKFLWRYYNNQKKMEQMK